jgi:ATP phosphoribosyltransferase
MLRIAVPNKGTLAGPASEMLTEAGYRQRHEPRDLTVIDPVNDIEFFFLRPKDIAIYVGSGELDLGITGRDLALDSGAPVTARLRLLHLPLRRARERGPEGHRPGRQACRHVLPAART